MSALEQLATALGASSQEKFYAYVFRALASAIDSGVLDVEQVVTHDDLSKGRLELRIVFHESVGTTGGQGG